MRAARLVRFDHAAHLLAAGGLTPVDPESPNTDRIEDLYWFITLWAALVLLSVAIPLVLFVVRYRSRGRPRTVEGPQVHGSTRLEIAWTAVPGAQSYSVLRNERRDDVFLELTRVTTGTSFTDLGVEVERSVTIAEVNAAFKAAADGPMSGIVAYNDEELVSADYIGNPASCILDAKSTNVVDGTLVKVSGWYDNEWGYASRCVDLIRFMGARIESREPAAVGR